MHLESAWFLLLDDLQIVITSYQAESELFISNISLHADLCIGDNTNNSICGTLRLSARAAVASSTGLWTRTSISSTQAGTMCAICVAIARISLRFASCDNMKVRSISGAGGVQYIYGMRMHWKIITTTSISFAIGVRSGFRLKTTWTNTMIKSIPGGVRFVVWYSTRRITNGWYRLYSTVKTGNCEN